MTRFEQFQQNVQQWSTDRGIYEHSTALAQALKAVSEVGELADAVIKGDRAALIDAVGDVAVCLVNVAHMRAHTWDVGYIYDDEPSRRPLAERAAFVSKAVGDAVLSVTGSAMMRQRLGDYLDAAMYTLYGLCVGSPKGFDDCCEAAWQQIKDRKGRMVAGGAFVKEDA